MVVRPRRTCNYYVALNHPKGARAIRGVGFATQLNGLRECRVLGKIFKQLCCGLAASVVQLAELPLGRFAELDFPAVAHTLCLSGGCN